MLQMLSNLCRKQILRSLGWSSRLTTRYETRSSRSLLATPHTTRTLTSASYARWNLDRPALRYGRCVQNAAQRQSAATRMASTIPESQMHESVASEGIDAQLSPEEMEEIIERVNEVWPSFEQDPAGWSSDWQNWPYLLTYFWLSPYYLRLPQVDMIVNIKHHVQGQVQPVLYSTQSRGFIFTIVEDPEHFFLLDGEEGNLLLFKEIDSEEALFELLQSDADSILAKLYPVEPHPDGEAALQRIFARDETVIDLLEKEFLGYRPVATTPEQEGVAPMPAEMTEAQEKALLEGMQKDSEEWDRLYGTSEDAAKETPEDVLEGPVPIKELVDSAFEDIRKLPDEEIQALARLRGLSKNTSEGAKVTKEDEAAAWKELEEEAKRIADDSKGKYS